MEIPKRPAYPRLPVPPLSQTLDGYLQSLEPIMQDLEDEGIENLSLLRQQRKTWAHEFETGLGKQCQQRLIGLDHASPYNWLDDNFWLRKAYHENRQPLLIQSNWWLALKHEPALLEVKPHKIGPGSDFTDIQLKRAAWIVYRFVEVKNLIEKGEIYPTSSGKDHWARRPALSGYNRYRIPLLGCDIFSHPPTVRDPSSRKVVVMLKGQYYAMEVVDQDGGTRRPSVIFQCLTQMATESAQHESDVSVGILSTSDRSSWAENRQNLVSLSERNAAQMRLFENCLFMLALDSPSDVPTHPTAYDKGSHYDSFLHSIRSGAKARNRWLDKGFTLIVLPDGNAGMSGEHSPCDALVSSMVADQALAEPLDPSTLTPNDATCKPVFETVTWDVNEQLVAACRKAEVDAVALIDDSDDSLLWFTGFGTEWCREASVPFDAFIQIAMQLAWYKEHRQFTSVYETALTRVFLHGRTETIRSYTTQSRHFIAACMDPNESWQMRKALLDAATRTHVTLTRRASTGRGIDRHLLGLRLVMKEGESTPLFDDPLFSRSQEWLLSTSGLSEGKRFIGTGFGATFTNGYGINFCRYASPAQPAFWNRIQDFMPTYFNSPV